jgi:hypothetical protein
MGPEYGTLYSTPEEALASGDEPVLTIPMDDFLDALNDPEVQAMIARAHRMNQSGIEFMKEVAPNVFVVDPHLARRAEMHAVEDSPDQNQ